MPKIATLIVALMGANLMQATEFGYYLLVVIIGEILEMSCVGWTRILLIRYASTELGLCHASTKRLSILAAGFVVLAIMLASLLSFVIAPERFVEILIATSFYVFSFASLKTGLTYLQIRQCSSLHSIIESIRAFLFIAATVSVMYFVGSFVYASIAGSMVVLTFGVISVFVGLSSTDKTGASTVSWQAIVQAGFPIILISILSYIIISLDKMILGSNFSKEIVAVYSLAFSLGRQGFDVIGNAINLNNFPMLVRKKETAGDEGAQIQLQRTFILILATTIPIAGILLAARNFLATLVLPSYYHEAITVVLPFVVFGSIMMNIKNFCFDNIFHIYQKNFYQLPTIAAGAFTSILAATIVPYDNPLIATSMIFISGATVSFVSSMFISRKFLKFQIPLIFIAIIMIISLAAYYSCVEILSQNKSIYFNICGICLVAIITSIISLILCKFYSEQEL